MSLPLEYAFLPSPNPIRASPASGPASVIDLVVMITPPTPAGVAVTQIEIKIPVGHDDGLHLSSVPSLPGPVYDHSSGWKIEATGSVVTVKPGSGGSSTLGGTLLFTLPKITVTQSPGTVPITVVEEPGGSDKSSYSLVKWPSDFMVSSFYADPPALNDLDAPTTLHWKGSADYDYSLHSDSWRPRDCVGAGQCYSAADGVKGVQTLPLVNPTTTFTLDVIKTDADGRKVVASVDTVVRVDVPTVSPNSFIDQFPSGRLLTLHWLAGNAGHCTVQVDGVTVDDAAPLDTYHRGYSLMLGGDMGTTHTVTVVARAVSGNAQAPHPFPPVAIQNHSSTNLIMNGLQPQAAAIAPDGSVGLVASAYTNMLAIYVPPGGPQWGYLELHGSRGNVALAVTPDSALALVTNAAGNLVSVVDLAQRSVEPASISLKAAPAAVAVTPDGANALVACADQTIGVIDVEGRAVARTIPLGAAPTDIAVTPSGTALVLTSASNLLTVDVAAGTVTGRLAVGPWASRLAVSPDGQVALTANPNNWSVTMVDVPALSVTATVGAGRGSGYDGPISAAFMPDGRLALVGQSQVNPGGDYVSVLDVAARAFLPQTIGTGNYPMSIAIAPDGSLAMVVASPDNALTII